ncbi:hypothetical protein EDD18DRAFT_1112464 [Armillaria luteobubalina]|uniref:Uncharacterized protein n=1 Tax=Armillaria luteobubalina TaxID=153913 RepID=A0AA39UDP7_9AGAR|nr:hypothetical protein EDD18DRAFT_1112464 [Armillaria luteobubalina]
MVVLTTLTLKSCIWTPNLVDITTTEYVSYTQSIKALTYGMDSALVLAVIWDTSSEIGPSHKCDSTASAGRASIVTEITYIVIFAVPIIGFLSCLRNRHQAPDRVSLTLTSCAAATITATSIVHAIFLILGLEHLSDLTTAIESGVSLMAVNIAATVGVGRRLGLRCNTDFNNSISGNTLPSHRGHTSNGWYRLLPKPLEGLTNSIFESESRPYILTRSPPQHPRPGILAERSPMTGILKYGLTVPARGRRGQPVPPPAAKPVPKLVRFEKPRWPGSDPALHMDVWDEYLIDEDPFQRR